MLQVLPHIQKKYITEPQSVYANIIKRSFDGCFAAGGGNTCHMLFENASVGATKRYFGWSGEYSECPHVFEISSPIVAELFSLRFNLYTCICMCEHMLVLGQDAEVKSLQGKRWTVEKWKQWKGKYELVKLKAAQKWVAT